MSGLNSAILEAAEQHLGVKEWPGSKHNPAVLAFFADSGNSWVKDDETAWCAAFVNSVLASLGLPGTGKLNARSFESYGDKVNLADVRPGDIAVFWRNDPNGWQGHVAFVVSLEGGSVNVLGGNQGNEVSVRPYPLSRIVAFRRATGIATTNATNRPTLKEGSKGAFVADLQDQLAELNYLAGRVDGDFGPNTRRAVVQLQSDNGLKADGIVGPKTWAVFETAKPRTGRDVTVDDLRVSGSRTVTEADEAETITKTGAGALVGLGSVEVAIEAVENFTGSADTLSAAQAILFENWAILLVIVIGITAYFWGGKIMSKFRSIRVDDARSGANLKR